MAKKNTSKAAKAYYSTYRLLNKRLSNKIKKLTFYVGRNPNDKQAAKVLKGL